MVMLCPHLGEFMWLSLMWSAVAGNTDIQDRSSEPSGFFLVESSGDVQPDSNTEAEESVEETNSLLRQYWIRSLYEHPDFERAHRLTVIGNRTQIAGGALVVGGGVLTVASLFKTVLCSDPDCGVDGTLSGLLIASLGSVAYSSGLGISLLGSYAAHDVLLAKGIDVSNTGIKISTLGMLVGTLSVRWYGMQDYEEWSGWALPVVLGSIATIPIGLVVQQRINKKAYLEFVGQMSLAPIWTPDSTGALVQFQF